jgi:methyl-accepting chemotaxis protein
LQAQQEACAQTGEARAPDPQILLDQLKSTYVMKDQHEIHSGGEVSQKADEEITFF